MSALVNMADIKDMDVLLYSKCGNYKVKPTEQQRDYILNFLKNSSDNCVRKCCNYRKNRNNLRGM